MELGNRLTEIATREAALDTFLSGTAPVVLLAELARVAGDDTHFTAFRFDGGTINVDGHGASAAALAEVIEGSPMFRNPTFRAAVTPVATAASSSPWASKSKGIPVTALTPAGSADSHPSTHSSNTARNRRPEAR